jgi:hypothetical protein
MNYLIPDQLMLEVYEKLYDILLETHPNCMLYKGTKRACDALSKRIIYYSLQNQQHHAPTDHDVYVTPSMFKKRRAITLRSK